MKRIFVMLFVLAFSGALWAQQSVTVKEPAEQCYQDLKTNLPEAIRWNDQQMSVESQPLFTNMYGNVKLVAQIFPEKSDTECKISVALSAPTQSASTRWNAENSSPLWRNAHLFKARIESAMKAREKKGSQ